MTFPLDQILSGNLRGIQGATGAQGPANGPQGVQGTQGIQGVAGDVMYVDGGLPNSNYGGINNIDGGGV